MSTAIPPFLRRVILRNYKSIRECDVSLGPLTFLVGPNGAGKSNLLDALGFVAESLRGTMDQALSERGGFGEVCHRLDDTPVSFCVDLRLAMPQGGDASYRLVVIGKSHDNFEVQEEHCRISVKDAPIAEYEVRSGEVVGHSFEPALPASGDRLYLSVASGFPEFRPLFDLLAGMLLYSIDPKQTRECTFAHSWGRLRRDGGGVGYVLRQLERRSSEVKQRIDEYMRIILPTYGEVRVETLEEHLSRTGAYQAKAAVKSDKLFLWFVLHGTNGEVLFSSANMSDGTLHALGVLVALFQCADQPSNRPISIVGIEEPEATLHPAAAGVLFDALHEASHFTQVLVSSHSPDLLDIKDVDADSLRIVEMINGETVIGPVDHVSRSIMRDRLYTAGELLRQNQLRPETGSPGHVEAETESG